MVPVGVEHIGYVGHDGTDSEDIQIAERYVFSGAEILVGNVSPADQRYLIIDSEGLVVHAAIDARKTRYAIYRPGRAPCKGIENSNLEIRVRVECCHAGIKSLGEHVIDQQPYADSPVRRIQK